MTGDEVRSALMTWHREAYPLALPVFIRSRTGAGAAAMGLGGCGTWGFVATGRGGAERSTWNRCTFSGATASGWRLRRPRGRVSNPSASTAWSAASAASASSVIALYVSTLRVESPLVARSDTRSSVKDRPSRTHARSLSMPIDLRSAAIRSIRRNAGFHTLACASPQGPRGRGRRRCRPIGHPCRPRANRRRGARGRPGTAWRPRRARAAIGTLCTVENSANIGGSTRTQRA
jgi:hypothetical protein